MILFTVFFTLGVWLLQQQADLPPLSYAWLLALFPVARRIPENTLSRRLLRGCLIAFLCCASGFLYAAWQAKMRLAPTLPDQLQGQDIVITGVVATLPRMTEHGQRFAFDVEKSPSGSIPAHVYLASYTQAPLFRAAERWQLTVRLKQVHGSSNPHGFDFERWALQNNIRATGYVSAAPLMIDRQATGYRIAAWREAIRDKFIETLGLSPYTGVLTALAIGDQDSIPEQQWQIFRRTGIIHLMSISGLHITMLAGLSFAATHWLWRRSVQLTLRLPARKAASAAAMLVATGYSLLAGFGVPAQRTLYMALAVSCALWLNRNFSPGQILSIAMLSVLIPDPWAVLSPGFCLSFGAVALILYTVNNRIGKFNWWRESLTVQWAMSIGLIPLLLAYFGQLSLVSPLANAFAIPLVSLLIVPLTLLAAFLPSEVPLWLAHIAIDLAMMPLQALSNWPVWQQHSPPPWTVAIGMTGVLWLLSPRGMPARYLGLILMLPVFLNKPQAPESGSLRMIIFDVGQGLSVAVQTSNHTLLYDSGPQYWGDELHASLHLAGIHSLDGVILSHEDKDHSGGTAALLENMQTGWVMSSKKSSLNPCRDGMNWNWDGISFEILNPDQNKRLPGAQDNSCVLRIGSGAHHILLSGDIEKRGEARLLNSHAEKLDSDLLIVPHHGSSSSSGIEFVAAVLPDYAVFTSGYRNRFGHPKAEILQRYQDSGALLLRSDRDGAILIQMDAAGIRVEAYRRSRRHYWTAA